MFFICLSVFFFFCFLSFLPQLFPDYRFEWLVTEFAETISLELGES
jgi:hypothetical protein